MRKLFTLISLFTAFMMTANPPAVELKLWPDGAPNSNGLTPESESGEPSFIMGISEPILYVYPASNPNGTAIIMLPGGAYIGVAMEHEGHDMADWFNTMGVTYAVLKYRMPNGHSDVSLSDAEQAVRLMSEHAGEWGINPQSIGIMGASAGGHLATTLATHYSSETTRPAFQVLFYPVVSMQDDITHFGSREALLGKSFTKADVDNFSNELHVNANTPKAFIMVSSDDNTVPLAHTLRYVQALTDAGVHSAVHIYPVGGHGWGFHDSFPYKNNWTAELRDWLIREVFTPVTKND